MNETRRRARIAGLLYFLGGITAPFSLIYVPSKLIVTGDATATADRLRASGAILRLGMASELISTIIFIFVVLALYRLFQHVSQMHAIAMATLFLVSVPISLLNVVNEGAALLLVSGAPFLSVFAQGQLDALAYLFMRLHSQGIFVAAIFWGLWLFPFGILVMRSGFIPRILGVFLMIAGFAYPISSLTSLLLPQYARVVNQYAMVLEFGELPIVFWLLIWGAKAQASGSPRPPTGGEG